MATQERKQRKSLRDFLTIPATITTVSATLFDFATHPNGVRNGAHTFDYFYHSYHANNPELRNLFGTFIGEHIGNFGYSAAAMIPFTIASETVRTYAHQKESKLLEVVAETIPYLGFLTVAWLNFSVENYSGNDQFWGDMSFGLGAAVLAHYAMKSSIERYRSVRAEKQPIASPTSR